MINSKNIAAIIGLILIISSLYHHLSNEVISVISWDVYGYYIYLPAIFKYGDTTQYLFSADHLNQYYISSDLYQVMEWNGSKTPIYTIGMALIYLPFYFMADLVAYLLPNYANDGLSTPYQWGIIIASWVYAGIGLYYSRLALKTMKFSDHVVSLTLMAIFLGTNYFHYAAYENGMPHIYLYGLYAMLIYHTIKWHNSPNLRSIFLGSMSLALLCLARPSEVIAIIIPLGYGIYNGLSSIVKMQKVIKHYRHILTFSIVGISLVLIQIVFWKVNINEWIFNGYQGHHFDFLSPHIIDGISSYRKGWLIYSPVCLFGLAGIYWLYKKDTRWFYPIIIFTLVNIFIVMSWHIWWYASSFGMRAMIQSYALLAIPMAVCFEKILSRKMIKYPLLALCSFLIFLNQFQDWQYRNKILLQDEMNETFYWKSFLETELDPSLRRFIDSEDEYVGNSVMGEIIYSIIADSSDAKIQNEPSKVVPPESFGSTIRMDINKDIFPNNSNRWVSIRAKVFSKSDFFNAHSQARLVGAVKRKNENLKWKGIRFQSYLKLDSWQEVYFDFLIPENTQDGDYLEATIWNNGPDTIYVNEISVVQYGE